VLPRDSAPFGTVGTEKRAASRHHLPQAERYLVAFLCATWYREFWREIRPDALGVETRLPTLVTTEHVEKIQIGFASFSSGGGLETLSARVSLN
jgi:hypothetical protein